MLFEWMDAVVVRAALLAFHRFSEVVMQQGVTLGTRALTDYNSPPGKLSASSEKQKQRRHHDEDNDRAGPQVPTPFAAVSADDHTT